MPRFFKSPRKPLTAPSRVPELSELRHTVLQASWRRDQWVSRRRLALRWGLYYAGRYGLWIALLAAGAFWVWLYGLPAVMQSKPEPETPTLVLKSDELL